MNSRFSLIITSVLFFLSVLFSCEANTESKDNVPPQISKVAVNTRDTILLDDGKILRLNLDSLSDNRIDTIILGHRIFFSARFSDNEALSSYKIILDTVPENKGDYPNDTILYVKRGWSIFGLKDTIVSRQNNIITFDSIQGIRKNKFGIDSLGTYPVREGDYNFKVYCIDKAGNEDFINHRVRLLRRTTVLDNE